VKRLSDIKPRLHWRQYIVAVYSSRNRRL